MVKIKKIKIEETEEEGEALKVAEKYLRKLGKEYESVRIRENEIILVQRGVSEIVVEQRSISLDEAIDVIKEETKHLKDKVQKVADAIDQLLKAVDELTNETIYWPRPEQEAEAE